MTDDNYAGFEPLKGKVDWPDERHWVFSLGPPIEPTGEVRTGNLFVPSGCGWRSICC